MEPDTKAKKAIAELRLRETENANAIKALDARLTGICRSPK